jgi:non-specific serine/threonine protein kinase
MIGVIHMRKEEYRAALPPLEEAVAIARESGDGAQISDTLVKLGSVLFHLGEYERAKALIEESLSLARELGIEHTIAISLARLGMIALRQGAPGRAEAFFLEGLSRARASGIRRWTRWYLVGLAEVARLGGTIERAAKLVGASEGVAAALGHHYEPATRDEIERITTSVRAELDEATFSALSSEGRAMTLKEIIAFARPPTQARTIGATGDHEHQPEELTEREMEVLRLIAAGKSNHEIGRELVLSRRTVERHISNIYLKIGASGKVARATATAYALRQGLAT